MGLFDGTIYSNKARIERPDALLKATADRLRDPCVVVTQQGVPYKILSRIAHSSAKGSINYCYTGEATPQELTERLSLKRYAYKLFNNQLYHNMNDGKRLYKYTPNISMLYDYMLDKVPVVDLSLLRGQPIFIVNYIRGDVEDGKCILNDNIVLFGSIIVPAPHEEIGKRLLYNTNEGEGTTLFHTSLVTRPYSYKFAENSLGYAVMPGMMMDLSVVALNTMPFYIALDCNNITFYEDIPMLLKQFCKNESEYNKGLKCLKNTMLISRQQIPKIQGIIADSNSKANYI